jgi:putative sterol carrier protein
VAVTAKREVSEGPTSWFFHAIAARGSEPALAAVSGTLRFDLADGNARTERWSVAMRKGQIDVSRRNTKADCVVRLPGGLFDEIVSGRANMMAALLRGAVDVEGDIGLLVLFQRLFPARSANPS